MKKFMIVLQIFVALLFIVKIVALAEVAQKTAPDSAATGAPKRAAAETPPPNVATSARESTDDGLSKSRDLLKSLEARKEKLEKKEHFLKSEEQRLLLLKKEILEKIDLLRFQEEKLTAALEAGKTAESKRYKDLAKVFEATPPAKDCCRHYDEHETGQGRRHLGLPESPEGRGNYPRDYQRGKTESQLRQLPFRSRYIFQPPRLS